MSDQLQKRFIELDLQTGAVLSIFKNAIYRFGENRGAEAAASISYYAFFSLFPLLLVLVAAGSYLLAGDPTQSVLNFAAQVIPVSRSLIERNLQQVLEQRETFGVIGLITLIWSASGGFAVFVKNINLAWPNAEERGFLEQRSLALVLILILFLLLIGSIAATSFLGSIFFPTVADVSTNQTIVWAWSITSNFFSWLLTILLFMGMYRWLPNTQVNSSAAFWGALLSATALEVASSGFTWYLRSGLSRYKLIYGSLGAVIALLIMIYIASWIILFGAYLSAAIQGSHQKKGRIRRKQE